MNIGIIGTGRVGCAMALALSSKGLKISGIYNRTPEAAADLRSSIGCSCRNDIVQVVVDCDIVFLTVSDTAISDIVSVIADKCNCDAMKDKVFLHCSGALASDVLQPLADAGAFIGSLHPIQTFADKENGWMGMKEIYFGYEGSQEAFKYASEIVKILDGTLLEIRPEQKALYHAAACMLSNYMVTLSYASGILLELAGITKSEGNKAFMPLLRNTVENIGLVGSENALTGPIARGDVKTVARHIEAIENSSQELSNLYKALGSATVGLALGKGSISIFKAQALLDLMRQQ